ncbi:hypothetical protein ACFE04_028860 [Oxalis oulophora]
MMMPIAAGPWGGKGGSPWDDLPSSSSSSSVIIKKFVIVHAGAIDSINIEYHHINGKPTWTSKHGGHNGEKTSTVKLDYPNEYLIEMCGRYGRMDERGPVIIRSLTFRSNKKKYGPYGREEGTCFSIPLSGAMIVGFHGTAGQYLDSIGIYLRPIQIGIASVPENAGQEVKVVNETKKKEKQNVAMPVAVNDKVPQKSERVITYGPWGGNGGLTFNDGAGFTGIRQITLTRSVAVVSMKVQYDLKGETVWGSKHGGVGAFITDNVCFDYPSEVLTHITGTYGRLMFMGPNVIGSITFHTNKGKHGPYGEESGPSFTSKIEGGGKIVGFTGKEGIFLDAIGGLQFIKMMLAGFFCPIKACLVKTDLILVAWYHLVLCIGHKSSKMTTSTLSNNGCHSFSNSQKEKSKSPWPVVPSGWLPSAALVLFFFVTPLDVIPSRCPPPGLFLCIHCRSSLWWMNSPATPRLSVPILLMVCSIEEGNRKLPGCR